MPSVPKELWIPQELLPTLFGFAVFSTSYPGEQVVCTESGASEQTKALTQQEWSLRVLFVCLFSKYTLFLSIRNSTTDYVAF